MIREAEKNLDFHLVIRKPGGIGGGCSLLSAEGEAFLAKYRSFRARSEQAIADVFAEYLGKEDG